MLNRWIGIVVIGGMILANTVIFVEDMLPYYLPDDTPPTYAQTLRPDEDREVQVGIFDARGHLIGRSWTRASRSSQGEIVTISSTTALQPLRLPIGHGTPQVRVETHLTYEAGAERVDELDFRMFGLPVEARLRGELMPTGEFACTWNLGEQEGRFLIESHAPKAWGDMIRRFDRLPNLHVGQSWRIKLLDPLAMLKPDMADSGMELEPIIVEVTRTEEIEHRGRKIETFVVEGADATAWVADDGRVLRQEVQVPLLGKLLLLDEPFDAVAHELARAGRELPPARTNETEITP
jgi:hypothetical protein